MEEEIKFSDWQEGPPPHDGVWQIEVHSVWDHNKTYTYFAKFQDGQWGPGNHLQRVKTIPFKPYAPNNNPLKPIRWRGRLPD